jgi:hypothetical protein
MDKPPIIYFAEDFRERLEACLMWHSELLDWDQRYTPDLTPGERRWLDDNLSIYARRYRNARDSFLESSQPLLKAAGETGIAAPLFTEAVIEIATEDYPRHSLDRWDQHEDDILQEAVRIEVASLGLRQTPPALDQATQVNADATGPNGWGSVTQAAETIDVAKSTITKLCDKKVIRCVGNGRHRRVDLNSLIPYKKKLDAQRLERDERQPPPSSIHERLRSRSE